MKRQQFARTICALFALALSFGPGLPSVRLAAAQYASSGEFVLRAPADRVAAIASRYGLTVVRAVEGHPDVFLVRGPIQPPSNQDVQIMALAGGPSPAQQLINV